VNECIFNSIELSAPFSILQAGRKGQQEFKNIKKNPFFLRFDSWLKKKLKMDFNPFSGIKCVYYRGIGSYILKSLKRSVEIEGSKGKKYVYSPKFSTLT